jgi:hypothetical protein
MMDSEQLFAIPVLYLDPDWSFMEFLIAASQRLDIVPSATRAFNVNGKYSAQELVIILKPISVY